VRKGGVMAMETLLCGKCGITFAVPSHFYRECREEGPNKTWYCPNGHPRVFAESETDKVRRERDRLAQRVAEKDDEIKRQREMREAAERSASAARGQVTRIRNRVAKGVCPCCNRTFENLSRHMATKHPHFSADAA
jgi:hypothetical protein